MALETLSGTLGKKRAAHLLRRATFGFSKEDIDHFSTLTAETAVHLLFGEGIPDPLLPVDPKTSEEWISHPASEANSSEADLQRFFKAWVLGQMFAQNLPEHSKFSYNTREKISFFLHTHFTTIVSIVDNSRFLYYQNQLFRKYAFDKHNIIKLQQIENEVGEEGDEPQYSEREIPVNLKELTKKVCVDNAMLVFLDGRLNVKGSPNENFAREMFELYTIGKGLEGNLPSGLDKGDYLHFTEQDVQAAARVLSGWNTDETLSNLDQDNDLPRGKVRGGSVADSHDNTTKQFSHRFNNTIITPNPQLLLGNQPTEASAYDEISQMIEMIYRQEETALHICRKIYRFFVYHEISETIEREVISAMAETFKANDFKIQPVLEELFKSRHFYEGSGGYSDDNFGSIIKSPLDLAVGTLNFFMVKLPDPENASSDFYETADALVRSMSGQGFNLYEPVEVAGYPAYHQFPGFNRNWISTNWLTRRYEFIRKVFSSMNMQESSVLKVNVLDFVKQHIPVEIASDAKSLIIELAGYLFPQAENLTFERDADEEAEITAERLNYFLMAFLYEPQLDAEPEEAWNIRYTRELDMEVQQRQLESLLNAMLQSPEYQLM